jgi:hypothetical protein
MTASKPAATAATTWWIEYENGDRSTDYASEAAAWAALVELQSSSQHSRPAWLFSSDGDRFAIPVKDPTRDHS